MTTRRTLDRWLDRVGGGRLAARFVASSLALLLLVQLAGLAVVQRSTALNVRAQVDAELETGERVWLRQLDNHAQRLRQAAAVLATDYGFRAAIASNDLPTIDSALENHGGRIGATVTALLDTRFTPRAMQSATDAAPPAALLHDVAARLAEDRAGNGIAVVDDQVLQFVAVPVRAPLVVGWVMMGFPVDQAVVDDMYRLSHLHVALLAGTAGATPRVAAATLPQDAAATALAALAADPAADTLPVAGDTLRARRVALPALGGRVQTLLLRSQAEVAQPLRAQQLVLLAITAGALGLFALGSLWTARRVTAPLRALVRASDELGGGDYTHVVDGTARADEIGDLARAFDHMRVNLAAHAAELKHLAYADRLTQLPNRAGLVEALRTAIEAARAGGAHGRLAVLMLDLDRFKGVNDVLGYAVGDRLLAGVARRLVDEVARPGDVVARLGGDEFALLLPGADADTALGIATRVATSFVRPLVLDDQTVDLGAGVGIARWPEDADDADTLLVRAEVAMYGAKHRREPVRLYDPAADSRSAHTLSLLSDLRRAVQGGELRLFLQPKVGLADGRLVGAEALVRWQHPKRGLVPPLDFIPFAEETGFVRQLTLWVFEEAARQWRTLAADMPLRISVNLSTRDLLDPELPSRFRAVLARHDVPASAFCLEITESFFMDDTQRSRATMQALSDAGFKLSIDDFGTGYSSLAYLSELPVQELKIDRRFVQGMHSNPGDAKIVRSTIDLAHNLGLSVVAEGIEGAPDMEMLARLGCEEGQGFHLSRPLPLADFVAWARRWRGEAVDSEAAQAG